jgi:NADH-quinone oxidoreductase subunit G
VGALNNKPYRYQARAWEMTQHPLISPHDSVGTNIYAHVLRGRVMRIVPRQNDEINETWIADRDRYSYEGIYSADRQQKPMVREGNVWREVDWQTALQLAAEKLGKIARESASSESKASQLGVLAAANSTLEELHLVARIARDLGSSNLDYRLRQSDFRDQANDPVFPWLGCSINELEQINSVLIVGSNIRKAAPILAHRVRKAAVAGAKVSFVNPAKYEYLFPVVGYLTSNGLGMIDHLAAVLSAACQLTGRAAPAAAANFISATQVNDQQRAVAAQLTQGDKRLVLLGEIAQRDADYSALRSLAAALAEVTGAQLGYLPEGGNAVGASLAGVLPHRTVGGQAAQKLGLNVADMLAARLKAYVLVGAIEPGKDIAAPGAVDALKLAECVIALTPYNGAKDYAHIILPIGTFAETSGTYLNLEGRWQSVPGAAKPVGEARPGWKVLRVLGNLLNLTGFEYESAEEVREEIKAQIGDVKPDNRYESRSTITRSASSERATDVGIYAVDPIVRRATALQQTRDALAAGGQ